MKGYKYSQNLISEGEASYPVWLVVYGKHRIDWMYLSEYPEPVIRMWN